MGLRIRTNVSSLIAQRRLSDSTIDTNKNLEQLASGLRINRSSDDSAGLAVSEKMKAKITSLTQAKRNASDGISLVQIAEGGMNEVSNILMRLRELAVQSSSDTIGNRERSLVNLEYQQLVEEIDRISNSTEFNGRKLLKGKEGNEGNSIITLHIGAGDGVIPNTDTIHINVENLRLDPEKDFNLHHEAEIGPVAPDDDFDRETATSQLKIIDSALDKVSGRRAILGSKQTRLNSAITNLSIQMENLKTANSRIRNVDYAEATAQLTKNRILQSAGVSVLSQANQAPELALSLLR